MHINPINTYGATVEQNLLDRLELYLQSLGRQVDACLFDYPSISINISKISNCNVSRHRTTRDSKFPWDNPFPVAGIHHIAESLGLVLGLGFRILLAYLG